ncbi:S8 family peptidase [Hyphomicrobium sulfonivorans]|uniref:S8 family peptidase n=1 Tax=Hyphomicrobium sulfonivorans TaxID=121290 RepID=UPI00157006F3|nr:S8 family serine peptidase [Hyphomicrobium sulfonivorans]MBI1650920.1 S8 family serine peptidase [Hyphomicrobium sulfonivorans]NSL72697.1 hypothetical protein [Hyphomicrobium sulfonivorans]
MRNKHSFPLAMAALLGAASFSATASAQSVMDAEFNAQWGLAAINAQYALERGITGQGVAVGVVDGIFETTHPEFAGRIYPFEYNPNHLAPNAHGTHVAGIIGAARNGVGMEGVAPDVLLAPIWAFDTDDNLAVAYRNAMNAGVTIFNNSWGLSNERDITTVTRADAIATIGQPLISALYETVRDGGALIWAAGNAGLANPDLYAGLPYLFPEMVPGWIVVTAVDQNLQNWGVNSCGVTAMFCMAAPGASIYSTVPVDTYGTMGGTSMATPHVTGAVALAKQMFPNATGAELTALVLRTATDIGAPGIDAEFGWGLLNVGNLVSVYDAAGDSGTLFANSAFSRFAAVDTSMVTLWNRNAQRIMAQAGGSGGSGVTVAQLMTPAPTPPMALGMAPPRTDISNSDAVVFGASSGPAMWAQGLGGYSRVSSSGSKASASLGGVIGGYDFAGSSNFSGGVAIAYTHSRLDTRGANDDSSADGWHGFGYGTWTENRWFIDGIIGGNWFDNSYKRGGIAGLDNTVLGNAGLAGGSSNSSRGFAGRLSTGYLFDGGTYAWMPYAYATWLHQRNGAALEGGADIFALAINSTTHDQFEGGIGTRIAANGLVWQAFNITPSVDIGYARVGGDVALPVSYEFLGSAFTARASDIGRDVLRVGAQIDVLRFDEMIGGFVAYDGRFQQNAQNNAFSGGLIVRF